MIVITRGEEREQGSKGELKQNKEGERDQGTMYVGKLKTHVLQDKSCPSVLGTKAAVFVVS